MKQILGSFLSTITSLSMLAACSSGSDTPAPAPAPKSEAPKPSDQTSTSADKNQDQGQSAANQSAVNKSGPTDKSDKQAAVANQPDSKTVPTAPVPNPRSVAEVLAPIDGVQLGLARLFSETHPREIEEAKTQIVDEIFSNEGESQGKIVEIQASIAKLAQSGLYSPEVKNRVTYLQSGIRDRIQNDQYANVLESGVFFVGTGAVLGTLAGTGFYRHLPETGAAIKAGYNDAQIAARAKIADTYARSRSAINEVRDTITDPEKRNAVVDRTRESVRLFKTSAVESSGRMKEELLQVARKPFKDIREMVKDNMDQLGVLDIYKNQIRSLDPVVPGNLPIDVQFKPTSIGTFKYAVVDKFNGEQLALDRVLVFQQKRLIRGNPFDTTLVSNPIPVDTAASIDRALTESMEASNTTQSRQIVHFMNLKTGAVSALRWPLDKFQAMLATAGTKVKPLFMSIDVPTALGTGATTAAAMGIVYWYGFDKGETKGQQQDVLNLESMVQPAAQTGQTVSFQDVEK